MIKYVDLGVSEQEFDLDIVPLIKPIFLKGDFIGGDSVRIFEENFAKYCGCKYAVALNSGTDALILSMRAMGIGVGDEVITVANSFIATVNSVVLLGATPVFVEIGEDLLIDPDCIEVAITDRTKAILPVHLAGLACDMDRINKLAERYGLYVIEDAAQSAGSLYKTKKTGSLGHVGCFSMHPLKNLAGIGDGGIVTTSDDLIFENLKILRNHGLKNRDEQAIISGVSRLDAINAVILDARLKRLDFIVEQRCRKANLYKQYLSGLQHVFLPIEYNDRLHSYHVYIIRVANRDRLMQYLYDYGIETKIHYPKIMTDQYPYSAYAQPIKTKQINGEILTLPIANVGDDEILYITSKIKDFYS